jgi:beta propeller repeat protein
MKKNILSSGLFVTMIIAQLSMASGYNNFVIHQGNYEHGRPDISGDIVVWMDSRSGSNDWGVYGYDLSNDEELVIKPHAASFTSFPIYPPSIYNNTIVWIDHRNGNRDIYGKDLGGSEFGVCINGTKKDYLAVHHNMVVWQDKRSGIWDIYGADITDRLNPTEFQICIGQGAHYPAIYENLVVWQEDPGNNNISDVYGKYLNIGNRFPICIESTDQRHPVVYGKVVVWQDSRNNNYDIYAADISDPMNPVEFQITTNGADQTYPAIFANLVVWKDFRNNDLAIYGADISDPLNPVEFQITDELANLDSSRVKISNRTVVWRDYRSGNWDIYGAFVPKPPIIAVIDVDPDTLNKKSHGQWITAYITLPDGYNVANIHVSSIAITTLVGESCPPEYGQPADASFTPQIGDRDEDGIADLTIKFDRQVLLPNLCLDDVAVTIEGDLTTGEHFSGSDTIRIIDRGK